MIWNAARGGMRSVVECYKDDGFLAEQNVKLIAAYEDGNFFVRQAVCGLALLRLLVILMFCRIELVHCHAAMYGSFWRKSLFAILARMFKVPVILHLHGSEMQKFHAAQKPIIQRLIVRQLTRATRVVVLSESWRSYIHEIAPEARTIVVPNYISLPDPVKRAPHEKTTFAFLGVLGRRKGIYDLLAAMAKARERVPELSLLVGGNGEVENARKVAADLGVSDCVTFLGWVISAKRVEILQSADVYALPSYNEGLPMSLLEAMSYGLPVLTTPVGGIPELVTDGVEGLVVEPGNVDAIAEAIVKFANDRVWRVNAGKAGRKRVAENYAREIILPRLRSLYEEVTVSI